MQEKQLKRLNQLVLFIFIFQNKVNINWDRRMCGVGVEVLLKIK